MMYFVIPCYNEELTVKDTAFNLLSLMDKLSLSGKILFVNDKSEDGTERIINELIKEKNGKIEMITTGKNVGQQMAISEGLRFISGKCDFAITLDCDLQDDISSVFDMIKKYERGAEAVLGVRRSRETDSFLKRFTAEVYYSVLKIIDKTTVKNHGDFRLMSGEVIEKAIKACGKYPYFRGLIPKLTDKCETVYYDRLLRTKGKSKYNIPKMIKLSLSGIYTAFKF